MPDIPTGIQRTASSTGAASAEHAQEQEARAARCREKLSGTDASDGAGSAQTQLEIFQGIMERRIKSADRGASGVAARRTHGCARHQGQGQRLAFQSPLRVPGRHALTSSAHGQGIQIERETSLGKRRIKPCESRDTVLHCHRGGRVGSRAGVARCTSRGDQAAIRLGRGYLSRGWHRAGRRRGAPCTCRCLLVESRRSG